MRMRRLDSATECTHLILGILKRNAHLIHGLKDQSKRLDDVGEHDWFPFELLVLAEALRVNQLHLLEHCGLARLAGTCRETIA